MVVAASVIELHIHGCRSLKEKRGVLRSISRRLRNRFNVAVAEVDADTRPIRIHTSEAEAEEGAPISDGATEAVSDVIYNATVKHSVDSKSFDRLVDNGSILHSTVTAVVTGTPYVRVNVDDATENVVEVPVADAI